MGTHVNYSGLVIAGVGFFLTRFTVVLPIYDDVVRFYLAGVVPLALGLGLAAFGVALTVADVEQAVVRTTALWCLVGTGTMLVLVALTLVGSTTGGLPDLATLRSRTYLSNFLIGGSIGGTLTGLYAARNRRQRRALQHQANRLEILNRILRHEVLNADGHPDAREAIKEKSDTITHTIEDVKYLTRGAGANGVSGEAVDIEDPVETSVDVVSEAYPEVDISVGSLPEGVTVRADDHLVRVFTQLLENATIHTDDGDPRVEIGVTATDNTVSVSVRDDGPGLPESQQELLETGDIKEYDDPGKGFGLNVVRLLVEDYGGRIDTEVDESGTSVTVTLRRLDTETTGLPVGQSDLTGVRPSVPHLVVTLGAAILAGVCYGLVAELLGGSVGFIGVYYGIQNSVVGWIAHEFHSIVFAFAFASLVSMAPPRYRDWVPAYVAIGTAWGGVLWIVAAGFVSPTWLTLLGIPVSIPSFSVDILVAHLVWGGSLGALTAVGFRSVVPLLSGIWR
jgi:signal transduction histidine kinase